MERTARSSGKQRWKKLIRDALDWYLRIDAELWDELSAWQEVRDEALQLVEGNAT